MSDCPERELPTRDLVHERLHNLVSAVRCQAMLHARRSKWKDPLEGLLTFAAAKAGFYSGQSRLGHRLSLSDFPRISRSMVVTDTTAFHTFRSSSGITVRTTSGTTGAPLSVSRDSASLYDFTYESYRDTFDHIPELRRSRIGSGRIAVLQINDNPDRPTQLVINPSLRYSVVTQLIIGASEEQDRQIIDCINEHRPPLISGRPRSLLRLTELLDSAGLGSKKRVAPRAIVSSGDNLYERDRQTIQTTLSAPVYNAYVSQEAGFAAIQCPRGPWLHVLNRRAIFEIAPSAGGDVTNSGHGELVVSNLENWAMPFIRYGTADIGEIRQTECACGHRGTSIVALDGRDSTYFVVEHRRVNPSILNPVFESLPVRQFQVSQIDRDRFEVMWTARPGSDVSTTTNTIRRHLANLLPRAFVAVKHVTTVAPAGVKVQRYVRRFPISLQSNT